MVAYLKAGEEATERGKMRLSGTFIAGRGGGEVIVVLHIGIGQPMVGRRGDGSPASIGLARSHCSSGWGPYH
jgi:hypothetical protein